MTAPRIPNLFAVPDLKEKLLFTLLCLAIYRLCAHIATPGVIVQVLADFIHRTPVDQKAAGIVTDKLLVFVKFEFH